MRFDDFIAIAFTCLFSSGLAMFFMKKWIEHSFNARLSNMEAISRIQALEHQVRFTRYDGNVALALEGAYALVCTYSENVQNAVQAIYSPDEESANAAVNMVEQTAREFEKFMHRQAIYLPQAIALKLRETRIALRDAYASELEESRKTAHQKPMVYSPLLKGTYQTGKLRSVCDDLLLQLQEMLREHLSRFVQPN